jgi:hypothetical protein
MKKLALLAAGLVLLVACDNAPAGATDAGHGWSYVKGPHGEPCLAYETGLSNNKTTSVTCSDVWPTPTPAN